MSVWKPIETAPKGFVPILVAYDNGSVEFVEESGQFSWKPYTGPSPVADSPTHWMPIPEPPEVA